MVEATLVGGPLDGDRRAVNLSDPQWIVVVSSRFNREKGSIEYEKYYYRRDPDSFNYIWDGESVPKQSGV